MDSIDSIRALAEPLLAAAGLELWDVESSRDSLRILVDRPGGVDLDALTAATAAVSPLLDAHPELTPGGSYQLEVSSPGLERSLRTQAQYERYVGQLVTIKTAVAIGGSRRFRGRLLAAGSATVTLGPEQSGSEPPVELQYDQIDRARTVLQWGPTPKPSAAKASAANPKDSAS